MSAHRDMKGAMTLPVLFPADEPLALILTDEARRCRLAAGGEIDACSAPRLAAALDGAIDRDPQEIVVDLGAVTFLNCAGVHALATAYHRATAAGIRLRVAVSSPSALRPLQLSGLWQMLGTGPAKDGPSHAG